MRRLEAALVVSIVCAAALIAQGQATVVKDVNFGPESRQLFIT